jgi:hypothetical protein
MIEFDDYSDEYDPDEDIKDCPVPGCRYKQIFVSGTDYSEECWLVCKTCGDVVVDESKEKKD